VNDAQFAAYSAYLRELGDAMLLRDWVIDLDRTCADSDTWAQVTVYDHENGCRVYLRWPHFFTESREDRREWLVHELLHPALDRQHRVVHQLAEQLPENAACQFAKKAHRKEVEICVQKLARIIAPFMPLPPEIQHDGV
jgi:hypothetical protein